MCVSPVYIKVEPNAFDRMRGISSSQYIPVPCGKCVECLKDRQNNLSIRVLNEALYRQTSIHFITLTYKPGKLPIASSLWKVSCFNGLYSRISEPELVSDVDLSVLRECNLISNRVNVVEKKIDSFSQFDEYNDYVVRFTPSLNLRDPRLLIKRFRIDRKRKFNEVVDLSYVLVGEYGTKNSHRPHYHVITFGLTDDQVHYLSDLWSLEYGFAYVEKVKVSYNDYAKVSRYVGKYCSKGAFDVSSVREGLVIKSRICSSVGLGSHVTENLKAYHLCYDVFGYYSPHNLSIFSREQIEKELIPMVVSRLSYDISGYKYKLPLSIRKNVFEFNISKSDGKVEPSLLWYEIATYLRGRVVESREREFRSFISNYPSKDISSAVAAFEMYIQDSLLLRKSCKEQNFIKSLSKSKL